MSKSNSQAKLPKLTMEEIADYLINGYWEDNGSVARSWSQDDLTITFNLDGLTEEFREMARLAFAVWGEASALEFVEVEDSESADITFSSIEGGSFANVDKHGSTIDSATINIDPNYDPGLNSLLSEVLVHEIGHALGLGHAGDYNGLPDNRHYRNDTQQFSIMSYYDQSKFHNASNLSVLTPAMADLVAIREIYGEASVIRETDTVYGFHVSGQTAATGALYDFSNYLDGEMGSETAPCLTLVDSGGTDTLDCSLYESDQRLTLKAGTWSDVGAYRKNIGIDIDTVIENAIGGGGNDRLLGNEADNILTGNAGKDRISGRRGDDILTGGEGDDIFVYRAGFGRDTITDFTSGEDQIAIRGQLLDFDDILAMAHQEGDDLAIHFGDGDVLILENVAIADLAPQDFGL